MKEDDTGKVRVAETVLEKIKNNAFDTKGCEHIKEIQVVTPSAQGCEECLAIGDRWVHLRLCLTCGHVGCCDDSKNKHASRHFRETGHTMIVTYEPNENWLWCYEHEQGWLP